MSINTWEHFFKPDVRSAGLALVNKNKVAVSQPSDTELVVYIRATPGFKVIFKTLSVESQTVNVSCHCPIAQKNKFCKHMWAGLLASQNKHADFFDSKTDLETAEFSSTKIAPAATSAQSLTKSAAFSERQALYKQKQADYRKEQYQKQKQRQKDYKKSKKSIPQKIEFPSDVERALSFFSENGIELKDCLNQQAVSTAKKKLARIFHPDLGGQHDEIVKLNNCTDILIDYIDRHGL